MTTRLERTLSREVLLNGQPYKVALSPAGVRITEKGKRKGVEVTWETILTLSQEPARTVVEPDEKVAMPQAIGTELAQAIRGANALLERAAASLMRISGIPRALLTEAGHDRVYGSREHRNDWFVEPLLTTEEVASVLRVSRSSVPHLGLASVLVAGERRYRQSAIREYIAHHEEQGRRY